MAADTRPVPARRYRRAMHWRNGFSGPRLSGILRSKGEVLELMGRKDEASAIYRENIAWAEGNGDRREQADSLLRLGIVLQSFGQYDTALEMMKRARSLFGVLGEATKEGRALGIIGSILSQRQDQKSAWEYYEMQARTEDGRIRAMAACNMGVCCLQMGDYDRSRRLLEESLAYFRTAGDRLFEGMALSNLGLVRKNQGDLDGAETLYRQAMELAKQIGDLEGIARLTGTIGVLKKLRGNFKEAEECYRRQLEISERIGDFKSQTNALLSLGILLSEEGRFGPAIELMERCQDIEQKAGDAIGLCYAKANIGIVYWLMNKLVPSATYLKQAIELCRATGHRALLATCLHYLSVALMADGKVDEARRMVAEGLEISEQLGLKERRFNFRLLEARILASEDREEAIKLLEELAAEAGTPPTGASLAYEVALVSKNPRDIDTAIKRYEELCAANPRMEWKKALGELRQMADQKK